MGQNHNSRNNIKITSVHIPLPMFSKTTSIIPQGSYALASPKLIQCIVRILGHCISSGVCFHKQNNILKYTFDQLTLIISFSLL